MTTTTEQDPALLDDFQQFPPYARLSSELETLSKNAGALQAEMQRAREAEAGWAIDVAAAEEVDALDSGGGGRARKIRDKQAELRNRVAELQVRLDANLRAQDKRLAERVTLKDQFAAAKFTSYSAELEKLLLGSIPDLVAIAERMAAAQAIVLNARRLKLKLPLANLVLPELTFACGFNNVATPYGIAPGETIFRTMLSIFLEELQKAGYNVPAWRDDQKSAAAECSADRFHSTASHLMSGALIQERADKPKLENARERERTMGGLMRRLLGEVGIGL